MSPICCLLLMAAGEPPQRLVLEGVPRVGFYPKQSTGGPEDHCFPACVRSILEYLDDDIYADWLTEPNGDWHTVHVFGMGASGQGFATIWPRGAWDVGGNWDILGYTADPLEPIRRIFEAVGYDHAVLLRSEMRDALGVEAPVSDDEDEYRRRIAESLMAGRPVIALGVLHPPVPSLLCGYDEDGDVLCGWDFFQDEQPGEVEPQGYFRRRDWFDGLRGIIVVGEKHARPEQADVYRQALARALRLMRTDEIRGRPAGDAAYAAWLDDLADDEACELATPEELAAWRFACDDMGGHLAEARCWAGLFCDAAGRVAPQAAGELGEVCGCFMAIHDLVWRLWQTSGDAPAEVKAQQFCEPELRAELSRIVALMRAEDAAATVHLQAALEQLGELDLPPASEATTALCAARRARIAACGGDRRRFISEGTDGSYVADVPALPQDGQDHGQVAALAVALAPTRHPVDYVDVMGWSGLAFATPWPEPGSLGEGELAALELGTGWHIRSEALPADPAEIARQRIVTDLTVAVREGLPSVIGHGDAWASVYGYHIWSANLFLRDPAAPGDAPVRVAGNDAALSGPVLMLDSYAEPQAASPWRPTAAALASAREALARWRDDLPQPGPAAEAYAANRRGLASLADARRAAAEFVERRGAGGAAEAYRAEAELLDALLADWGGPEEPVEFTPAMRDAQAAALARALELEAQATAALAG